MRGPSVAGDDGSCPARTRGLRIDHSYRLQESEGEILESDSQHGVHDQLCNRARRAGCLALDAARSVVGQWLQYSLQPNRPGDLSRILRSAHLHCGRSATIGAKRKTSSKEVSMMSVFSF